MQRSTQIGTAFLLLLLIITPQTLGFSFQGKSSIARQLIQTQRDQQRTLGTSSSPIQADCPTQGEQINRSPYQEAINQQTCRAQLQDTLYYPYVVTQVTTADNGTFEVYSIEYCNNVQQNWMASSSPIMKKLNVKVSYMSPETVDIKITTPEENRWEIPHEEPFPHFTHGPKGTKDTSLFEVKVTNSPFAFEVIRKSTGESIFNTKGHHFIYSDKYIEITTNLPTDNIYGLGERASDFNIGDGSFSMFAKDAPWTTENGRLGNNLYGEHPMYLQREQKNYFSTVFLRNSNAMDVQVKNGKTLTFHTVGGILDFIFFAGDQSPETSIQQYHDYLGGWKLFPFWSFGFHQCRWGYKSADTLNEVVNNFNSHDLPMDVIWSDIDYMVSYVDFTIDTNRYQSNQMQKIHDAGKRFVPILDAGIGRGDTTHLFREGQDKDVYLKNYEGHYLDGSVWPGAVYFPDFFHPNSSGWWQDGMKSLTNQVKYDGMWLDMNEMSNFCEGQCNWRDNCNGPFDKLPYTPTGGNLHSKTVRMDSKHYSKDSSKSVYEYDVHNFFGFLQSKATHDYLLKQSELTFVLSRSTAPGSGKYAAHWLGDNDATWNWLKMSISGAMTFNIFGVPMVGSDICGFNSDTNENLCARWMQVGNLYPFARNHNHQDFKSQEPYALGGTVLQTSRIALRLRYSLLKFYYSLFTSKSGKGTIFRPVFFEFPTDSKLFEKGNKYTDAQFMLGRSVMVTPVIQDHTDVVNAYFPQDDWYNFFTGQKIHSITEAGKEIRVAAPLNDTIPMFIRGGHIVHTQNAQKVMSTTDLNNMFSLVVALQGDDNMKQATGSLMGIQDFEDSNIVEKCQNTNCMLNITVEYGVSNTMIQTFVFVEAQDPDMAHKLEEVGLYQIHFYGIPYEKMSQAVILLNGAQIDNAFVGQVEGRDYPVVYLPDVVIQHKDIILIEKLKDSMDI